MNSFLKAIKRNRLSIFGCIFFLSMLVLIIFPSHIAPYNPNNLNFGDRLKTPSFVHLFGTDSYGRDMFSRVIFGTRNSLFAAGGVIIIALLIGIPLGLVGGYFGGLSDDVLMRLIDVLVAFPPLILALLIISTFGRGLIFVVISLGIVYSALFTRLVRGTVLSVKEENYIEAAKAVGASHIRISILHILRNIVGPITVQATLNFGFALLDEAAFDFLGLGAQHPTITWGILVQEGKNLLRIAPWISVFPGLFVLLSVLSINGIGEALRDILDPKSLTDKGTHG